MMVGSWSDSNISSSENEDEIEDKESETAKKALMCLLATENPK